MSSLPDETQTRRSGWSRLRLLGGLLILVVLGWRLGVGPFVDGIRRINIASLAIALGVTALTTVLSAWRWRVIAGQLGLRTSLGGAVAAYYRSQFLNSALPGGVVGDVHRGIRQGQQAQDVSLGVRSVVWDRSSGQIVQVAIAAIAILALPSPVRPAAEIIVGVAAGAAALVGLIILVLPRRGHSWLARVRRTVGSDLRGRLMTRRVVVRVTLVSALIVLGHVGVFLVAARTDGLAISTGQLVPLALLILLSMTVPISLGGWGPREGMAAWAFAAAGLGAVRGVEVATIYGVLSLVATLPGAVVLLVGRRRPRVPSTALRPVSAPAAALAGAGSVRSDG